MSLKKLELHIFIKERPGRLAYFIDDQETQSYQNGHYNTACIDAEADGHQVKVTITESGNDEMGTVNFRPVLYGRHQGRKMATTINGKPKSKALKPSTRQWVCKSIAVLA